MKLRVAVLGLFLLSGCHIFRKPVPKIADTAPAIGAVTAVTQTQSQITDKASGYNAGAQFAVQTMPASRAKDVTLQLLGDQQFLLGAPTPQTKDFYETLAGGLLSENEAIQTKAEADLKKDAAALETVKEQYTTQLAAANKQLNDLTAQYNLEKVAQDQRVKDIVAYIFFGIAALCILGGIAMAVLAGSYPLFGPKAAISLGLAGVVSGASGVAIIKLLDTSVVYWGVGFVVLLVVVACVLVYANHNHATTSTNGPAK